MRKIFPLHPQIVSKIAAGEVIERPVYAVKELVENALDAGADLITIATEESGLKKIMVIDNGEGMSKEDLLECFKPHTTSKLTDEDTLSKIHTLGFRGEALASIAAISNVTIASKVVDQPNGMSVSLKNGQVGKVEPIGMPNGTQVKIDYLFHSVPARKHFLKSQRTEFRLIVELVSSYALAYPSVHFVLTHNNKTILDLPKSIELTDRIEKLLGKDIYHALVPIEYKDAYITISGYLVKPSLTTRTPSKQFLFVNERQIRDKNLSLKIKASYGTLLESSVYPICILSFSMPYEMVDVNVHPRKEEVRFSNQQMVHDTIEKVIKDAFGEHMAINNTYWDSPLGLSGFSLHDAPGATTSYAGKLLKEKKFPWELHLETQPDTTNIIQINNLYLLVPDKNGFLIIDQHAAHERIRYEQLLEEFTAEKSKRTSYFFPKPEVFEVSLSEGELLQEYMPLFSDLGWEIEHFKGNSYLLLSIPMLFQDRNYIHLLQEMLEDIKENEKPQALDALSKKMLAYLACHSAVRAGDSLTKKQSKELVEQLSISPNSMTCPHGRPTRVVIQK
ncbi:MAG: DNA mismatch repair endonuclease MutL, partial [Candidatus Levyibacteriota bacterium]